MLFAGVQLCEVASIFDVSLQQRRLQEGRRQRELLYLLCSHKPTEHKNPA